jgi:hypothetical protein
LAGSLVAPGIDDPFLVPITGITSLRRQISQDPNNRDAVDAKCPVSLPVTGISV